MRLRARYFLFGIITGMAMWFAIVMPWSIYDLALILVVLADIGFVAWADGKPFPVEET